MDSIVIIVGVIILIGMVFMLVKTASVIHHAPRPEGEQQNLPDQDKDKQS